MHQQPFIFEEGVLKDLANVNKEQFSNGKPFPHVVIDNFFPEDVLNKIVKEFPLPSDEKMAWIKYDGKLDKKKLESKYEHQLGRYTRQFIAQLNSSLFIDFLENLTGLTGIIPDPHLFGGGLHQIECGGFVKIHADFNYQPHLKLDRRINFLLYLNKDWKEEYGGHLELWNKEMTHYEKKVLPVFNRCVIFATTDFSFHGHPEPLNCPVGQTRKSIALYYYSNGRPANEVSHLHSTLWQKRPHEKRVILWKEVVKSFIPPIVMNGMKYVRDFSRKKV